jgi:hypothetical protein
MRIDYETPHYALYYDARSGTGLILRRADSDMTPPITGDELAELRRMLNRAKTNATSKRRPYPSFAEIADVLLGEFFLS